MGININRTNTFYKLVFFVNGASTPKLEHVYDFSLGSLAPNTSDGKSVEHNNVVYLEKGDKLMVKVKTLFDRPVSENISLTRSTQENPTAFFEFYYIGE